MQTVTNAFTAEEKDTVRSPSHSLLMSWNKFNLLGNRTFTIGVSSIGGNDVIGANPGGIGSPGQWQYVDDSDYVMSLEWERQLNIPTGGLSKAYSEVELDNTSGRYLPEYMGGVSEFSTAILPKRPQIISAGFSDVNITQFSGLLNRQPTVNLGSRTVNLQADDYLGYFENKFVDDTAMFTGVTTDTIIGTMFQQAGMTTAQYDLDTGLNEIPFTIIESGQKMSDVLAELAMAENGYIFQDEEGIFKFWNRQKFYNSPYNQVQKILQTSQVINVESPNEDHIINVVEVNADIWTKRASQQIFSLSGTVEIIANQRTEFWANLDDPVLQVTSQSITANTAEDGTGSAITVSVVQREVFSQAIKYTLTAPTTGYITAFTINGRSAIVGEQFFSRMKDDSSVTAFQERPLSISNKYIQNRTWANSYSQVILDRFSEPDNVLKISIRAIPELQLGDLISWQGHYWRIFSIRASLDKSTGFVQDLVLVKPRLESYFTIGVSGIGGVDKIAA
jgi:hypothetical protein